MKRLLDYVQKSLVNYAMFMIHSSELMPGGSPYYKDAAAVEILYRQLEELFMYASNNYEGITLREYASDFKS